MKYCTALAAAALAAALLTVPALAQVVPPAAISVTGEATVSVPPDLADGYLEVHTITVDSAGNLYGGDNQYGRTQKFVPKPGADKSLLIGVPWSGR